MLRKFGAYVLCGIGAVAVGYGLVVSLPLAVEVLEKMLRKSEQGAKKDSGIDPDNA